MRTRSVVALVALCITWAIVYLRFHIHELGEIVLTYTTFYPLLHRHPDLLYRWPDSDASDRQGDEPASPAIVPRIINQIALGNASMSKYQAAIKSCTDLHPEWKHQIWSDQNATDFIAEHYPDILPHYVGYPQNIQRANILRYALLHHAGGVYIDLDVTCRVALDDTPLVRLPFVSPGAHPAGVNNAFIASQAGHPFLAQLLKSVPSHDLKWGLPMRIPYVENMLSTGCMFFSNQWMAYVRGLIRGRHNQSVFILANEKGEMAPHMLRGKVTTPIFIHGGASSWHGWDAALFLAISKHLRLTVFIVVAAISSAIASIYLCTTRRRSHRRRCRFFGGMSRKNSWSPSRARKSSIIGEAAV